MNNVFGAKSGYTCCLTNMHQGWTKFTSHLWYETPDGGLAALVYSPNNVSARVGKDQALITIREVTDYPFDDKIDFNIELAKTVEFPLSLRIPA